MEVKLNAKTEKNPFGAGRKPKAWKRKRVSCPEPLVGEIKQIIENWEKEQGK